ncbi:MAG: glycosyltransferase family 39 protein [Cyanobacteria bacterium SZAS LIN-3]|nr:glycosyltransferase family 39 protein [Cyanobacteria bacterium SZAS LIN-3]
MLDEQTNRTAETATAAGTTAGETVAPPDAPGDVLSGEKILLPFCYSVALALALRLFFNFCGGHPNAFASADASEYLRYTDALSKILTGQAAGPMSATLKEFVITGPGLPVFLLLATISTGQQFDPASSATALAAQSIISALTAGIICLITSRLFNARTALYAGLMAAAYPGFIVNSGRLYSETFATFVECLAVFLLVRGYFAGSKRTVNNFVLGLVLVVLQLTRSAMVLLTAAAAPIVFLQGLFTGSGGKQKDFRTAFLSLAMLLAGTLTMLAPWFVFEKAAFNKITLAVDRVGHYNLFVGTNTAIQGFLSYPYPDGRGIEQKSFFTLIKEAYKKSPSRFIKLAMDKPARLLKAPWNDFRAEIGPVTYKSQVAMHQAILLLALAGLLLATLVRPPGLEYGQEETRKIWGRLTLLLAFGLNLPYLAFITVPRYNLTAMPFLIIFAAAGLTAVMQILRTEKLAAAPKAMVVFALCLFFYLRDDLKDAFVFGQEPTANFFFVQGQDLVSKGIISVGFGLGFFGALYMSIALLQGHKKIARGLTVALAVLVLPLLAIPQRANGRPGEGIMTLERAGETLSGTIPLAAGSLSNSDENYLLLDCDSATILNRDLELTINGQKLTGPLIPAISALDDWHYLKQMGSGKSIRAYLECQYIYDCMCQPTGITNLDLRQWYYLPLSSAFIEEARRRGCLNVSLKHKIAESTRLYSAALNKDEATIPSRDIYSWEKAFYGVENDSGLSDGRYDEKVPARKAKWKMVFNDKSEDLERFDLNLRLLSLKPAAPSGDLQPCTAGGTTDVSLDIPENLQASKNQTLIGVHLTPPPDGNIKATAGQQPTLYLSWLDKNGTEIKMPLPFLKATPADLDVAVLCDLNKIEGSRLKAHVHCPDRSFRIEVSARAIGAHPIFGNGKLF